jgi:hypothetical protein
MEHLPGSESFQPHESISWTRGLPGLSEASEEEFRDHCEQPPYFTDQERGQRSEALMGARWEKNLLLIAKTQSFIHFLVTS